MSNLETYLNKITCGDCLDVMGKLPDESVDLVITSPPYNLKNSSGNGLKGHYDDLWKSAKLRDGYDGYDDNMPHELYVDWQRQCLSQMYRLLKPTGAIYYVHKWRVQDGIWQDRADIVSGFPLRQVIIWSRGSGMNFNEGYYLPTYEVIYLITKPDFKLNPGGNKAGDVWRILPDKGNEHPAPFPPQLVERILDTAPGQVVLDPFSGSGTTAYVCKKLGRDFVAIDQSSAYCALAENRIASVTRRLL